jgi:integrase
MGAAMMAVKTKTEAANGKPAADDGAGGRKRAAADPTLDELEKLVDADLKEEGAAVITLRHNRYLFARLKKLGYKKFSDLDENVIRQYQAAYKHLSDMSQRIYFGQLQSMLNRIYNSGYVNSIPALPPLAPIFSIPRPRALPPDPTEVHCLLNYLRHHASDSWEANRLYALASTLAFSGIEITRVTHLLVSDVDLFKDVIFTRGNSFQAKPRMRTRVPVAVPIPPELKPILAAWVRRTGCKWLFPGVRRKGPWCIQAGSKDGNSGYRQHLKAACQCAGVDGDDITADKLHRYFASNIKASARNARQQALAANIRPAVELAGPNEPARIRDKTKGVLTTAQYVAITALLEAFPRGLSMKEFDERTGKRTWRNTLKRLCDLDPEWASVIGFPGRGYRGKQSEFYRVVDW